VFVQFNAQLSTEVSRAKAALHGVELLLYPGREQTLTLLRQMEIELGLRFKNVNLYPPPSGCSQLSALLVQPPGPVVVSEKRGPITAGITDVTEALLALKPSSFRRFLH
jgi:hypothetical protein